MGAAYPEIVEQAETVDMWLSAEEEGFGRTLANGMELLRARDRAARERVAPARSQPRRSFCCTTPTAFHAR